MWKHCTACYINKINNDTKDRVYIYVVDMIKVRKVADRHYQASDILEMRIGGLLTVSLFLTH
jgi:Cdc6-like AAA superfamily ATPase